MGLIKNQVTYIPDTSITALDYLIGSDGDESGKTKNYLLSDLSTFFSASFVATEHEGYSETGTQVGEDMDVIVGGITGTYPVSLTLDQTAAFNGQAILRAGGAMISLYSNPQTVTINGTGGLVVENQVDVYNGSFSGRFLSTNVTATRSLEFPDASGIIALTSDYTLQSTTDNGKTTTNDMTITGGKVFFNVNGGGTANANLAADGGVSTTNSSGNYMRMNGDTYLMRTSGIDTIFVHSATGSNKTVTFQDLTGTVALLSDIGNTIYTGNGTVSTDRTVTVASETSLTFISSLGDSLAISDSGIIIDGIQGAFNIKSTSLDNQITFTNTSKMTFIAHQGMLLDLGSGGSATPPTTGDVVATSNASGDLEWVDRNAKSVIVDATTTYNFVLVDANDIVTLNNAGAVSAVVPANGAVAYPIGTQIDVINLGAGTVTLSITTDTLNQNVGGLTMAQYDKRTLTKVATTVWVLGY